jgi:hypothetical protein
LAAQVLNAPSYFGKLWGVLKQWVDPRTASKLIIVSRKDVLPTLVKSIDLASIPERFGGKLEFQHGSLPKLDKTICNALEWASEVPDQTLPAGPIKWVTDEQGRMKAVAVGTADGKSRRQHIATCR